MEVREAQEVIRKNLKYECIADVAETAGIAYSTAYRWRDRIVENPDLMTFIRLCDYYDISVSINDLKNFYKSR